MTGFNLQLEDYMNSIGDSIMTILTLTKDDHVRQTAWGIAEVKNNSELSIRVQHDLQHFFEMGNNKKFTRNLPEPSDFSKQLVQPISVRCVENDSNLTGLSSNDDMFSISSYFSTDDCPPTISPNCFSTESDEKLIERDDDVFSSEDEGKFLSQGDVVSCASQADILAEKMEEINPFVNILKMTMGEKIQDEDCWSREDMPSTQEEVCFSSSSKEYMDL